MSETRWMLKFADGLGTTTYRTHDEADDHARRRYSDSAKIVLVTITELPATPASPPWPPKWENCRHKATGKTARYAMAGPRHFEVELRGAHQWARFTRDQFAAEFEPI